MTKPTNPTSDTPVWLIERLALGELDAATAEQVRARLRAEGRDPEQVLAALAEDNRALLQAMPAPRAAAAIRARLAHQQPRPARRPLLWALPALGMAMAAVLVAGRLRPGTTGTTVVTDDIEDTRIKGSSLVPGKLAVYRQRDGRNERLGNGARAGRGDRVQLAYVMRAPAYGVVLSVDGGGQVTLHLPQRDANSASPLQSVGREVELPESYELDDAPAFERFFLITSPHPFPVAPVVQAAQTLAASAAAQTGPLPLPASFWQASLRLEKTHKEQP